MHIAGLFFCFQKFDFTLAIFDVLWYDIHVEISAKCEVMEVLIRRADICDISHISRLLSQVLDIHHNGRPDIFKAGAVKYTPKELEEIISDDTRPVFVAEIDGEVGGYAFCQLQQHRNDNILTDIKTLYIDDLCVDETLRGKHIGKALYEYVLDFAKKTGCYNLTLNVWEENSAARKFYENCGLAVQKTVMEKIL